MLTIDEIAKYFNISRNTVVNLVKNKKLHSIKVGSQYRIPKEIFEKFVNDNLTTNETKWYVNPDGSVDYLK